MTGVSTSWRSALLNHRHDMRRMWLFAAACLRETLRLTDGERYLPVVELIERNADNRASAEEIDAVCREFGQMYEVWFKQVAAYGVALHAGNLLEKATNGKRWTGWFAPPESSLAIQSG